MHNPWFRLLAPIFCGVLVYFLILLINDAVLSIQNNFLSQELFVCIALAYLTQEFSRVLLLVFEKITWFKSFVLKITFQLLSSIALTVCLVSVSMYFYFKYVLLFEASFNELVVFNGIFSFITVLYVVLYLGHFFLFKINSKKIEKEALAKLGVEHNFTSYVKGINPELLFESLEAMLVIMKDSPSKAEQLSDYFSTVYRYILSKRNRELVDIDEEMEVVKNFVQLLNHLPNRKVELREVGHISGKIFLQHF